MANQGWNPAPSPSHRVEVAMLKSAGRTSPKNHIIGWELTVEIYNVIFSL